MRVACTALLCLVAGARATASPAPALELQYFAPEDPDCPREVAFKEMVAARLGVDPWQARGAVVAEVRILGAAPRFTGIMRLREPRGAALGERRFQASPSCRELAETIAFALVLAVDPLHSARPEPKPSPPPVEPPSEEPAPSNPSPAPERPTFQVVPALGVLGAAGTAPDLSFGVTAEAMAVWPRFGVGLEGRIEVPRSAALAAGGSVETSLFLAGLVPCAMFSRFSACFLARVGAMRISAQGLESPRSSTELYASLGVRGGYELPLGSDFGIRFALGLGFVLTRISLTDLAMAAPTRYWTTPLVNGDLAISLMFHRW
ncbi:MAG: hypothetical protein U1E65_28310 [Myxococcota bacterium]